MNDPWTTAPFVGPPEMLTEASMERLLIQFAEAGITGTDIRIPMRAHFDASAVRAWYGSSGL